MCCVEVHLNHSFIYRHAVDWSGNGLEPFKQVIRGSSHDSCVMQKLDSEWVIL